MVPESPCGHYRRAKFRLRLLERRAVQGTLLERYCHSSRSFKGSPHLPRRLTASAGASMTALVRILLRRFCGASEENQTERNAKQGGAAMHRRNGGCRAVRCARTKTRNSACPWQSSQSQPSAGTFLISVACPHAPTSIRLKGRKRRQTNKIVGLGWSSEGMCDVPTRICVYCHIRRIFTRCTQN